MTTSTVPLPYPAAVPPKAIWSNRLAERSVIYYTNKERRKRGLPKLSGSRRLRKAARGHSRWMARTGRFSHTGQGGSRVADRAARAGYLHGAGENIWMNPGTGRSGATYGSNFIWNSDWKMGKAAVISWMNSPGHRENILRPAYRHIGIGVARSRRGIYLTQNFGLGLDAGNFLRWTLFALPAAIPVLLLFYSAIADLAELDWITVGVPLFARGVFRGMLLGAGAIGVVLVVAILLNSSLNRRAKRKQRMK